MIHILFCGISGRMGKATYELCKNSEKYEIIAGIDPVNDFQFPFPVFKSVEQIENLPKPDVLIDFSHHSSLPNLLDYAECNRSPVIICTTGHTEEETKRMKKSSEKIPVFFSRNMSVGINLLIELSKKAAKLLGEDFNIEILEAHHNQKLDAPSGTALMIADEISQSVDYEAEYVYDRHEVRRKREKNEIGIHSIRGGTIVGQHSVIFAGPNEEITLSHQAESRAVFANGALHAAEFILNKPAGMYDMSDVVKGIL
jgi:4-hydroxy-tetrahydrodipicolinate reductase